MFGRELSWRGLSVVAGTVEAAVDAYRVAEELVTCFQMCEEDCQGRLRLLRGRPKVRDLNGALTMVEANYHRTSAIIDEAGWRAVLSDHEGC